MTRYLVAVTWTQLICLQWKGAAAERRTFGRLLAFDDEPSARRFIMRMHNEPQRSWIPMGSFEFEISEPILQPQARHAYSYPSRGRYVS